GRAAREATRGARPDDWTAFALLAAALSNELAPPLMVALTNCELLSSSLGPVLDVTDEFISWATLVTPTEHLRRLVARRTAAPSSDELVSMVADARVALSRASRLVRLLREITFPDDDSSSVSVATVLRDLRAMLANYMSARADLEIAAST